MSKEVKDRLEEVHAEIEALLEHVTHRLRAIHAKRTDDQAKDKSLERSKQIIYASGGRALLLQDVDIFSGAGIHVARMQGNVAYDPSGRYVGTLVDDRLVFQDEDSLTVGPLFVRTTHPGFADLGNTSQRTLDREVLVGE